MKCVDVSAWMLVSRAADKLPAALHEHVRLCPRCRRLRRRLGRLDQAFRDGPVVDNPAARARLMACLPQRPVAAKPTAVAAEPPPARWLRWARVAAAVLVGAGLASILFIAFYHPAARPEGTRPPESAADSPEEQLVARLLEHDLDLAGAFNAGDQLPPLSKM